MIRGAKLVKVSQALAKQHYAEHAKKPFFGELVTFITSSPTLAMVLEGEGAIASVRSTMGSTNPADSTPGSIRGDLALVDAGQPRPRVGLAALGAARDQALVHRRELV